MKMPTNKLVYYLIVIFSFLLLFLIILLNLFSKKSTSNISSISTTSLPSPTSIDSLIIRRVPMISIIPPSTNNLPTYAPEKGQGVDLEAPLIKKSTEEIQKLYKFLPLNQEVKLSTGQTVSIVIPEQNLQNNPWTLTVQIFGIDYEVPQSDSSYLLMKNSFRETANVIFSWMKNNNANPQNIIISWGDRKFIQDRAEEWLKN